MPTQTKAKPTGRKALAQVNQQIMAASSRVAGELVSLDTSAMLQRLEHIALNAEEDKDAIGAVALLLKYTQPYTEERVAVSLGPLESLADIEAATNYVTQQMALGILPTRQCREITSLLQVRMTLLEHRTAHDQIAVLEAKLAAATRSSGDGDLLETPTRYAVGEPEVTYTVDDPED